jgi:sugar O-acyltransferase (sialic acid O-acetyltransferase NeuD family)
MKRCLIVGAGGAGREIMSWVLDMQQAEWSFGGFLDKNAAALQGKDVPFGIVGDPATWQPGEDDLFVAGIGDPETRLRICSGLQARGARFISILHSTVRLGWNARVAEGCVLGPYTVVSVNAAVDRFVAMNHFCGIGHDVRVGEGSTISSFCDLMGGVEVGRCCYIGSHASVLLNKKVGDYARVGPGSAVIRNVRSRTTVMGVPAQVMVAGKIPDRETD